MSKSQRDMIIRSDINIFRNYGVPQRLISYARYYLYQGYSHEEAAKRVINR